MSNKIILFLVSCFLAGGTAAAAPVPGLKPDEIHTASAKKTNIYLKEGVVVGGDRSIDDVVILDIRRGLLARQGYERIVLDIEGNRKGEPTAIERPPYYHVGFSEDGRQLTVTIMGRPKLAFNPKKVKQAFSKSPVLNGIDLYPLVEKDRWNFVLTLKGAAPVEVFELTNPARIILDVRTTN